MIRVDEFRRIEDLAPLRADWQTLLGQTTDASFFQSLEWLEVYWRHFSEGQTLRVLAVREDGRTLGIVPFVVRPVKVKFRTLRYLTYPLDGWGSFYGPIGPQPFRTLEAALVHLRRTKRDWDVLELRWVNTDRTDDGTTRDALRSARLSAREALWEEIAWIELAGTYDDYAAARSKSWRKNRRKNEERIAALGEIEFLRHRPRGEAHGDGDPRWNLYDAAEQIAGRSWQGDSTTGTTLSDAAVRPFLRDAHAAACRLGAADLSLLAANGRPLAFYYGYQFQGRVDAIRTGFDPRVEGAGAVILDRVIRDSYERGDRLIDIGPGSIEYKSRWCTSFLRSDKYTHHSPRSLWAQLLSLGQWAKRRLPARASV
ncbi:MAG: GNAT family N-acetyltransferase [Planctomycetaceae bacterium]